jgi:hypothetical protein
MKSTHSILGTRGYDVWSQLPPTCGLKPDNHRTRSTSGNRLKLGNLVVIYS